MYFTFCKTQKPIMQPIQYRDTRRNKLLLSLNFSLFFFDLIISLNSKHSRAKISKDKADMTITTRNIPPTEVTLSDVDELDGPVPEQDAEDLHQTVFHLSISPASCILIMLKTKNKSDKIISGYIPTVVCEYICLWNVFGDLRGFSKFTLLLLVKKVCLGILRTTTLCMEP